MPSFLQLLPLLLLAGGCSHVFIVPGDLNHPGTAAATKRPKCNPSRTLRRLSKKPQSGLDFLDVASGALTDPLKKIGVFGWRDTGCNATLVGVPVRDAQHSSGGFWTLDLRLSKLEIEGQAAPQGRFIRIEVSPDTHAHEIASRTPIKAGTQLSVGGPVVIDEDGPFLEIHPGPDFRRGSGGAGAR